MDFNKLGSLMSCIPGFSSLDLKGAVLTLANSVRCINPASSLETAVQHPVACSVMFPSRELTLKLLALYHCKEGTIETI